MFSDIKTIAQSTFDRFFRMKELYLIIVLCIINVSILGRYNELTLQKGKEFMIDGAGAILAIVSLITAMVAIFEKSRELREKTATFIITKPGGRTSYIWGKFFGIVFLALWNLALITAGAFLMFKISALGLVVDEFSTNFIYSAFLTFAEAVVLTACGLFLSMFLSDTVAALLLFVIFVLGHSLYMLARSTGSAVVEVVTNVVPNLYNFNVRGEVLSGISSDYVGLAFTYGALYAVALVSLSVVLFSRKDLA